MTETGTGVFKIAQQRNKRDDYEPTERRRRLCFNNGTAAFSVGTDRLKTETFFFSAPINLVISCKNRGVSSFSRHPLIRLINKIFFVAKKNNNLSQVNNLAAVEKMLFKYGLS